MPLDKIYAPNKIESKWYQFWQEKGYFEPSNSSSEIDPYCIMIPPPNVTGSLHMGHAFHDLIMDALIRYNRMKGANTLWQPGTDHAGIATQMVVERSLNAQGKDRHDYGREKFIEKVWEWKEEFGGTIRQQLQRLGASADWENERFTMDEGLSNAVNEVFEKLYDEGLIYRGKRLVNWDPTLLTAVSDLEVVSEEASGVMYYVRYPFVDAENEKKHPESGIVIGTTRPETILVDGAIAVHPDDERFHSLVGQRVWVPMTEPPRVIEIITDTYVDPEFGSGCVKISAAHDFNDYEVYLRHPDKNIPLINLFTPDAKLNDNAPKDYRGLGRYAARKKIVKDLETQQLLVKQEPHKYKLPRCDRTGEVVEPMLTDQWYVDLTREKLADGRPGGKTAITDVAIEVVKSGRVQFVPDNWSKTYYQWLENIQDWCISRQIWWGHRIPAWYDEADKIYVGKTEKAVREKYSLPADCKLRQDEDVLDTWFSSALWPFSTLGWPEKTERLKTFYPTSVLVTGFDIIFFWVARMIMMGMKFMDEIPFNQVYIHGLVRDAHGNKMSKSKGNVLDPIDLIDGVDLEELVKKRTSGLMNPKDAGKIEAQVRKDFPKGIPSFGADALRFTFAALASTGRDINFDLARTEGYRNFCNKLWNAAHFVLINIEGQDCSKKKGMQLNAADIWIRGKLQHSIKLIHENFNSYRFDLIAKELHELTWKHYCDWYIEFAKIIINDENSSDAQRQAARHTLVDVLENILRLTHPIMPFITEEIWQSIRSYTDKDGETIMMQSYPDYDSSVIDESAEQSMQVIINIIIAIRNIRSENNISPAKSIPTIFITIPSKIKLSEDDLRNIKMLGKTESIQIIDSAKSKTKPNGAIAIIDDIQITIPLENLIDVSSEIKRVDKELTTLKNNIMKSEEKLANQSFVKKAPDEVVKKAKAQLKDMQTKQKTLTQQLETLRAE